MKPAIMVGTEDRILNRWAHFAKKHNFLALIGDGSTKYVLNFFLFFSFPFLFLSFFIFIVGSLDQNSLQK